VVYVLVKLEIESEFDSLPMTEAGLAYAPRAKRLEVLLRIERTRPIRRGLCLVRSDRVPTAHMPAERTRAGRHLRSEGIPDLRSVPAVAFKEFVVNGDGFCDCAGISHVKYKE